MSLLLLAGMFGAMWFFTIRPQQQRLRAQRALLSSLTVGDEVLTAGGLIGVVRSIADVEIGLEVGPGVEVRVARASVTTRLGPDRTTDDVA